MKELAIAVPGAGTVSALFDHPSSPWLCYVLAHGAGAGMRHPFLADVAGRLATHGIATLRYQFPYMEKKKGRPDPPHLAEATVRAAVDAASARVDAPLIAGGKSFGGRMTSHAQAEQRLPGVVGLVFLGFPLHPPGKVDSKRAEHLDRVSVPMLFLQGTRDSLANIDLMRQVCHRLGDRATLETVEDGDHSFKVPKRSGRTPEEVMHQLVTTIVEWGRALD
jgi:predicted alpha/beta-hydrolase family hydrolase